MLGASRGRMLAATVASAAVLVPCGAATAEAQRRLLVRKDAQAMTAGEKRAYVRAVLSSRAR